MPVAARRRAAKRFTGGEQEIAVVEKERNEEREQALDAKEKKEGERDATAARSPATRDALRR